LIGEEMPGQQKNVRRTFERVEDKSMIPYANTNIELFNQLSGERYTAADLGLIVKTYELARRLFTGRFQLHGKDFISHVVRTAEVTQWSIDIIKRQ